MHLVYIHRSQQLWDSCYLILDHILDYRMYPLHTTASAPSMRASEASFLPHTPAPMNDDPGNVKVVVRCRAFVPRGRVASAQLMHPDADESQRRRRAHNV